MAARLLERTFHQSVWDTFEGKREPVVLLLGEDVTRTVLDCGVKAQFWEPIEFGLVVPEFILTDSGRELFYDATLKLTEPGMKLTPGWALEVFKNYFPIAAPKLPVQVTAVDGITSGDTAGTKLVLFTWSYVLSGSAAPKLRTCFSNVDFRAHKGVAEFRAFDDGWRVMRVAEKLPGVPVKP